MFNSHSSLNYVNAVRPPVRKKPQRQVDHRNGRHPRSCVNRVLEDISTIFSWIFRARHAMLVGGLEHLYTFVIFPNSWDDDPI